jgi:hypothetical protein
MEEKRARVVANIAAIQRQQDIARQRAARALASETS